MTYLYYKTSSTGNIKPNETTIKHWKHLAEKKHWPKSCKNVRIEHILIKFNQIHGTKLCK